MADLRTQSPGAVVLLSGGLDSTVALADVLTRMPVVRVLAFDYGQRAVQRELAASRAIAAYYALPYQVIELPWLAALLPHAMRPDAALPPARQGNDRTLSREEWFAVEQVWVPNRNGLFLNIAACYAEALGAGTIVFGANAEEGAAFPDNTPEFRDQVNAALVYSTLNQVRVETPVGHLNKEEIIRHGLCLNVPLEKIWSCYLGQDSQCGECASCLRVKEARDRVAAASGQIAPISFQQA